MMKSILISYVCMATVVNADNYYLCGPDEDGCYPEIYQWCMGIREHPTLSSDPYCMDFDSLSCKPLTDMPQCPASDIRPNQSDCVATLFQSEPEPPCPLLDEAFFHENGIPLYSSN